MTDRTLNVWVNTNHIGSIREANGLWAFAYTSEWLDHPDAFELCPSLPLQHQEHIDGASRRPVQWFFDNLLPEEGQRSLIASASGAAIEDSFALLAYYGAESAGSITLLAPDGQPAPGGECRLPFEELSDRIQSMPEVPLANRSAKKMSLAGAQHKVAVIFRNGELFEPIGGTPSTHILKPDHPSDAWPHSVINEWFVMKLAQRVGLRVPEVTRLYVPQPVYLISRFDRVEHEDHWERLHCIDACQLLDLSREFKYSAGSIEKLALLAEMSSPAALARLSLFEWLVFNVLVGNEDAHLKNLSFLSYGRQNQLAPFYDLVCTAVYGTRAFDKDEWPMQANLAWPIFEVRHLNQVDAGLLCRAGEAMGIRAATANQKMAQIVRRVSEQSRSLLEQVESENAVLSRERPELRPVLAGEMRLLRSIVSTVIAEMVVKLI